MSVHRTIHFFSLLIFAPLLTVGQKAANAELATSVTDLIDKTFIMAEETDVIKAGNDLNLCLIFYKDEKATFRVKRGDTIIKDNSLSWRLVNDSLYIQNGPIQMTVGETTQTIDRDPIRYAIERAPGGYLFKDKNSQTLWLLAK